MDIRVAERRAVLSSIAAAVACTLLGTLLHFAYDFSGQNFVVGLFSAINESTWEHLKLLFMPFLLTLVVENIVYGRFFSNFLFAKLVGILSGMMVIVSGFYTYTGVIGRNIDFVNIALFVVGVLVAYGVALFMMLIHNRKKYDGVLEMISGVALVVLCALFFIFTYYPPSIGIFIEPTLPS